MFATQIMMLANLSILLILIGLLNASGFYLVQDSQSQTRANIEFSIIVFFVLSILMVSISNLIQRSEKFKIKRDTTPALNII